MTLARGSLPQRYSMTPGELNIAQTTASFFFRGVPFPINRSICDTYICRVTEMSSKLPVIYL